MPCIKSTNPGANMRVTFYWENYSIGSPRWPSFLVESMLVYAIHNFEYQLKCKNYNDGSQSLFEGYQNQHFSGDGQLMRIIRFPSILNGILNLWTKVCTASKQHPPPWSLYEGYNSLVENSLIGGDALLWKLRLVHVI